jgi:hypothetical protein
MQFGRTWILHGTDMEKKDEYCPGFAPCTVIATECGY